MGDAEIKAVVEGLRQFRSEIRVVSGKPWRELIGKALAEDPRRLVYIGDLKVTVLGMETTFLIDYIRKEVPIGDVFFADYFADALAAMMRTARRYGKTLYVVTRSALDLSGCAKLFIVQNGVSLPLLRNIRTEIAIRPDLSYSMHVFGFFYRLGRTKLEMMRIDAEKEAKRVAGVLFTPGMPVAAKVYLAHNYLAYTVKYQRHAVTKLQDCSKQCAYGALIEKLCVCQGFSEAFQMLMELGGVPSRLIEGTILKSGGGHAWNLIAIDGSRYSHVDVTWDAAGERPVYTYFMKGDATFKGLRKWNTSLNPSCAGDASILPAARRYVAAHRQELLDRGVEPAVLDL